MLNWVANIVVSALLTLAVNAAITAARDAASPSTPITVPMDEIQEA